MGNILTGTDKVHIDKNNNFNLEELDNYNKVEILEYIKKLKPINLDLGDDFNDKTKNITLENQNMMAMYIELYEKLVKILPQKKPENTKTKKILYVKPNFDTKVVSDNLKDVVEQKKYTLDSNSDIKTPEVSFNSDPITIEEFNNTFNEATYNKDMIGVSKKMLFSLPNYFKIRFINCMNKLYNGQLDAKDIAIGKGTYLYKFSKKGPHDNISSFRKIISIPNIVNHFHRIMTLRLYDYLTKNNYIDTDIQKGAIKQKVPLLQQICKMKEILKHANTNKNKLAVMFVDLSDAFNNINRDTMYQIMEQYHVDKNMINYIRSYYDNFEFYMQTKEWTTETFKWKHGIVQGCSMSPLLFIMCLNYMFKKLDQYKDECGYSLSDTLKVMLLAYIDDICIICKDKDSLVKMYERFEKALEILGLSINREKSAIMLVNEDETGLENTSIGKIPCVKSYKYLGEYISCDGSNTEAYNIFFRDLGRKLYSINKKKITNKEKFDIFDKLVLPSVHRKLTIMYDLTNNQKYNILVLVNRYINSWQDTEGLNNNIQLFSDSKAILSSIHDTVLNSFELQIDVQEDMDLNNYVFNNNKVEFKYGDKNHDDMINEILKN